MSERTFYERPVEIRGFKYIRLKSGRLATYYECRDAAENAQTDMVRAVSRAIKLAASDDDLERLEWFIENLEQYAASVHQHVREKRGVYDEKERIGLLRNTSGRTPEEAAEFLRKADELEQRLEAT